MGLIVEKANIMPIIKNHWRLTMKKDICDVSIVIVIFFFYRVCMNGLWLLFITDGNK